jgi:cyanophycin synthetase
MSPIALSATGFSGRLRPPEQTLRLALSHCPPAIDWLALDSWLQDKLGLALQSPLEGLPCAADQHSLSSAGALCWRILQVAAELQRVARVPVFEPGRILNLQPDEACSGGWVAKVAVATIDYVPAQSTQLVYEAATLLVLGAAAGPDNFAEAEPLYQQLETKVLQPLRAMMRVGVSTLPMLACAHERGIPWRHLGAGLFQLGWGAHSLYMQNSKVGSDSALGVAVVQNKWIAAEWMRRAGLPAPQHRLVANEAEAAAVQALLGWPLVVKPADRDRGEGVTVAITSEAALRNAYGLAAGLSSQVLVEREVEGLCHRLLVVRGKVVYVLKRMPIAVQGDGQRTISELIAAANAGQLALPLWAREPLYPTDSLTLECLQQAGWHLTSVLPAGTWARLRRIESTQWGGLDEDCSTTLHPDNAAIACRAAALFGLDVAGIDIISPDITRPWHENGAIINEVNSSPALGQSDSSRRTLPEVLTCLLPERGRICIDACVGADQALEIAQVRQQALRAKGVACYVTSHKVTLDPSGCVMHMAQDGLFARCLALLGDKRVEALVLVIQTNELLHTGLPVDTVNCLMSSGEQLSSHHQVGSCAKAAHSDELMAFLASFIATSCRKLYDPSTIDTFLVAPKASLFDVLELATPK